MKIKKLLKGDIITKISVAIMGFGHICRKQIALGMIYLLTQIIFIFYMVLFGGKYILMFFITISLYEKHLKKLTSCTVNTCEYKFFILTL